MGFEEFNVDKPQFGYYTRFGYILGDYQNNDLSLRQLYADAKRCIRNGAYVSNQVLMKFSLDDNEYKLLYVVFKNAQYLYYGTLDETFKGQYNDSEYEHPYLKKGIYDCYKHYKQTKSDNKTHESVYNNNLRNAINERLNVK